MLKALKRISYGSLIGGIVLFLIGIALLAVFINYSYEDFPIWFFSKEATGIVDNTRYELVGQEGDTMVFDFFLDYTFTDDKGEVIHGTTEVSMQEYGLYNIGWEIPIKYSPFDSYNNRVDDSRFVPLLLCSYVPVFMIILLMLVAGWRLVAGEIKKPPPIPRLDELQTSRE